MLITYEDFKNLVPKETFDFVNIALPMIDNFKDKGIYFSNESVNKEYSKLIIIFCYALDKMKDSALLFKYGFEPSATAICSINMPLVDKERCFKKYGHYFCIFDELYRYQSLTPYMILTNAYVYANIGEYSTSPELFGGFDNMKAFFKALKKMNAEEMFKKENDASNFNALPVDVIDYLEKVSKMHQLLENNNKNNNFDSLDIEVLSLFLTSLLENTNNKNINIASSYLKNNGIYLSFFEQVIASNGFTENIKKYQKNYLILNYHYKKYIDYLKNNKNIEDKDISIFTILELLKNREVSKSVQLEKLLLALNKNISILDDLETKVTSYSNQYQEEMMKNFLNNFPEEIKTFFEDVSRIHNLILEENNRNKEILETEKDIEEISMIIALLNYKAPLSYFLEKNGLTLDNIFEFCNLDKSLLKKLEITISSYKCVYEKYQNYLKFENKGSVSLVDIIKNMFNNSINDSLAIEKIVVKSGNVYKNLKEEIETEKDHIEEISLENRIDLLKNISVPTLTGDNLKSIINFGSDLSIHSQYIHTELPKMALNDKTEEATTSLSNVIEKLYEPIIPKPFDFMKKFLKVKSENKINNREFNLNLTSENIGELVTLINQNINKLEQEISNYDLMQKYLGVYLDKNEMFVLVLQKAILEAKKTIDVENEELSFAQKLEKNSKFKIMSDKLERFQTSILIIKQELVKLNQSIINHFVTINALETAKDDLIPIIQMELSMNAGIENEKRSLELSESVVSLFRSILARNVEASSINMEKLENYLSDEQTFIKIQKDVRNYFKELQNIENADTSVSIVEEEIPDSSDPKRILSNNRKKY